MEARQSSCKFYYTHTVLDQVITVGEHGFKSSLYNFTPFGILVILWDIILSGELSYARIQEGVLELLTGKSWYAIEHYDSIGVLAQVVASWLRMGQISEILYSREGSAHDPIWRASCLIGDYKLFCEGPSKKLVQREINIYIFIFRVGQPVPLLKRHTDWSYLDLCTHAAKFKNEVEDFMFGHDMRYTTFVDFEFCQELGTIIPLEIGVLALDKFERSVISDNQCLRAVLPKSHRLGSYRQGLVEYTDSYIYNPFSPDSLSQSWLELLRNSRLIVKGGAMDRHILKSLGVNSEIYDLGVVDGVIPISTEKLMKLRNEDSYAHSPMQETRSWYLTLLDAFMLNNEYTSFNKPIPMPRDGHCALYAVHQAYCSRPDKCDYFRLINLEVPFHSNKDTLLNCCVLDDSLRKHLMFAKANEYDLDIISRHIRIVDTSQMGSHFKLEGEGVRHLVLHSKGPVSGYQLRASGLHFEGQVGCLHLAAAKLLELTSCSPFHIKTQYRRMGFKYHPDRGGSVEEFIALREAYELLMNPVLLCLSYVSEEFCTSILQVFTQYDIEPTVGKVVLMLVGSIFIAYFLFKVVLTFYVDLFAILEMTLVKIVAIISFCLPGFLSVWLLAVANFWSLLVYIRWRLYHLCLSVMFYGWVFCVVKILLTMAWWFVGGGYMFYAGNPGKTKKADVMDGYRKVKIEPDVLLPYGISQQIIEERYCGKIIQYVVYWMPAAGYCPHLAAMFYHYLSAVNQGGQFKLANPLYVNELLTNANADLYFKIVRYYIAHLNLPNQPQLTLDEAVELFENVGVKGSSGGDMGLVVSDNLVGFRHFGILARTTISEGKLPSLYCSREVMDLAKVSVSGTIWKVGADYRVDNRHMEDFRRFDFDLHRAFDYYLMAIRKLTGSKDAMVEVPELSFFLDFVNRPHRIYSIESGKRTLLMDKGDGMDIDLDIAAEHFTLTPVTVIKSGPSKDMIMVPVKQPEPDLVEPDMDKFAELIKRYSIDLCVIGGKVPFATHHWTSKGNYFGRLKDATVVNMGDKIRLSLANAVYENVRSFNAPADDLIIGESIYRAIEFVKFSHYTVVIRLIVQPDHYQLDAGIWRLEHRKRFSFDERHDKALDEFVLLDGKINLIKTDLSKALAAAQLFCYSATEVKPDIDWVSTHLLMKYREHIEKVADYECLFKEDYGEHARRLRAKELRDLFRVFIYDISPHLFNFSVIGRGYFMILICMLIKFYSYSYYVLAINYLILVTVLNCFVYSVYLRLGVSRLSSDNLKYAGKVDALSSNKLTALFGRLRINSPSLVKLEAYWRGEVISWPRLLLKLVSEPVLNKPIWHTPTIANEYWNKLSGYANASRLGALWALTERQLKPKALVKNGFEKYMDDGSVEALAEEILAVARRTELKGWDDYFAEIEPRKRSIYAKGRYRLMNESVKVSSQSTYIPKPYEKQHKLEKKTRALNNPNGATKVGAGHNMWNVLKCSKLTNTLRYNIACGRSPKEIELMCTEARLKFKNPVMWTADGVQWDSHQHRWFIASVDNKILRAVLPYFGRRLGYGPMVIRQIIENTTSLITQMRFNLDSKTLYRYSKLQLALVFQLMATVYSGHPSKTTWGNTVRALMFYKRVSGELGLVWNVDIIVMQAGDDTLVFMDEANVDAFNELLLRRSQEYGLMFQDIKTDNRIADFLSLDLVWENGCFTALRKAERVVQTGAISADVVDSQAASFDFAIVQQLKSWGFGIMGYDEYLEWRLSRIDIDSVNPRLVRKFRYKLAQEFSYIAQGAGGYRPLLFNMPEGYKYLAGSLGDPFRLLGYRS